MPREYVFPRAVNSALNAILHDADARRIIDTRRATLPAYLEMTEDEVYARTRAVPIAGWSFEQLRRLMELFAATDAPDLAGRVLRLMFPGLDVAFRAELTGSGEPRKSLMDDEGALVSGVGQSIETIADALEDGVIDPSEHDRISVALNRCQQTLNSLRADLESQVAPRKGA